MTTPRLASTQADPPRGWSPGLGRPGAPAPAFPSSRKDGDPSSCEYASRSPEGMVAGLGAARRSGSSVPLLAQGWRPLVLRVRKPIPRGDGRRAWGGPALRLQRSPPRARMATPRLASTQADPPRGCRRAWGGPALRLQRSPLRARMATPRLASTQADPPRGCRRAWGGPTLRLLFAHPRAHCDGSGEHAARPVGRGESWRASAGPPQGPPAIPSGDRLRYSQDEGPSFLLLTPSPRPGGISHNRDGACAGKSQPPRIATSGS